jgi:putative oxidoreductase
MEGLNRFFEKQKDFGLLLLRLLIGWRLVAGTWEYAVRIQPLSEVTGFFTALEIPAPAVSAIVSVYAQFACGILLLFGCLTRTSALLMVVNFSVAIVAAHLQDPIEKSFPAWALLVFSILLLINGAGKYSLDHYLFQKRTS